MRREFLLDENAESPLPLRLGLSLGGLDDADVRQVGAILIGLVAFEAVKEGILAHPIRAPPDFGEAAGEERLLQQTAVPEEAVAPGIEPAVDLQGGAQPPR